MVVKLCSEQVLERVSICWCKWLLHFQRNRPMSKGLLGVYSYLVHMEMMSDSGEPATVLWGAVAKSTTCGFPLQRRGLCIPNANGKLLWILYVAKHPTSTHNGYYINKAKSSLRTEGKGSDKEVKFISAFVSSVVLNIGIHMT